jgi:hypothetical protein
MMARMAIKLHSFFAIIKILNGLKSDPAVQMRFHVDPDLLFPIKPFTQYHLT